MALNAIIPFQHVSSPINYYRVKSLLGNPGGCNERFDLLSTLDTSYVPMISKMVMGAEFEQARTIAAQYPGRMWMFGKRPDSYFTNDPLKTTPQEFQAAALNWRNQFGRDYMALPGVQWGQPGATAWMDEYLSLPWRVIPKVWTMRVYKTTPTPTWESLLQSFKNYLDSKGVLGDREVWFSEATGNLPFSTMHSLGMKVFWYSSWNYDDDDMWWASYHNLTNQAGTALTPVGNDFKSVVTGGGGSSTG